MAVVRAIHVDGLKMWFYSDDHEPPHFHAKRQGEWEVKVHFLLAPEDMVELVWAETTLPRRSLQRLRRLAEAHRIELLREWEQIHGN